MNQSCVYWKYFGRKLRRGGKMYWALMLYKGQSRVSRKRFSKASQASIYGHRLAERASRLLGQKSGAS